MDAEQIMARFRATGALLNGHFLLSSGLHSRIYLQCALALQYPDVAEAIGQALAGRFQGQEIQLVASPAIGGIVIGYEVARALGVRFIWTERQDGRMSLRRGFSVLPKERTLVVEDVITTGGSTKETIEVLSRSGAEVIAAASIIDRSGGEADVGLPRIALVTLSVPSVKPSDCEACKRGEPVVKPGSRKGS